MPWSAPAVTCCRAETHAGKSVRCDGIDCRWNVHDEPGTSMTGGCTSLGSPARSPRPGSDSPIMIRPGQLSRAGSRSAGRRRWRRPCPGWRPGRRTRRPASSPRGGPSGLRRPTWSGRWPDRPRTRPRTAPTRPPRRSCPGKIHLLRPAQRATTPPKFASAAGGPPSVRISNDERTGCPARQAYTLRSIATRHTFDLIRETLWADHRHDLARQWVETPRS